MDWPLFSVYFWAIVIIVVLFLIALAFFALSSWWRPKRVSRGSIPARVPTPPKGTEVKRGKAPRAHAKPHIVAARVSKSVRTAHGLRGVCTVQTHPGPRRAQCRLPRKPLLAQQYHSCLALILIALTSPYGRQKQTPPVQCLLVAFRSLREP